MKELGVWCEEARITRIANFLAQKHGCSVQIDYATHTICFDGPEEAQAKLANEIDLCFNE